MTAILPGHLGDSHVGWQAVPTWNHARPIATNIEIPPLVPHPFPRRKSSSFLPSLAPGLGRRLSGARSRSVGVGAGCKVQPIPPRKHFTPRRACALRHAIDDCRTDPLHCGWPPSSPPLKF